MARIYISYSRKDFDAARIISEQLRRENFDIFFDAEIEAGVDWSRQIEQEIVNADVFLILISQNSVESKWIQRELGYAVDLAKPIIPILLERTQLPLRLAMIQYIDATGQDWNRVLNELNRALDASIGLERKISPATPVRAKFTRIPTLVAIIGLLLAFLAFLPSLIPILQPFQVQLPTPTFDSLSIAFSLLTQTAQSAVAFQETLSARETISAISTDFITQTRVAASVAETLTQVHATDEAVMTYALGTQQALETINAQATSNVSTNTPLPTFTSSAIPPTSTSTATLTLTPTNTLTPTPTKTATLDPKIQEIVDATVVAIRITEQSQLSPEEAARLTGITIESIQNGTNLNGFFSGILATMLLMVSAFGITFLLREPHLLPFARPSKILASTSSNAPEPLLEEYQVFVSSSEVDKEWVRRVVKDLTDLGFLVWWYAKDAPGLPFGENIKRAIYHTKVFVIVISPESMKSKHVEEEIRWKDVYNRPSINVVYRAVTVEERPYGLAKGSDVDFTNEREYKGSMEQLTHAINTYLKQRLEQLQGVLAADKTNGE